MKKFQRVQTKKGKKKNVYYLDSTLSIYNVLLLFQEIVKFCKDNLRSSETKLEFTEVNLNEKIIFHPAVNTVTTVKQQQKAQTTFPFLIFFLYTKREGRI